MISLIYLLLVHTAYVVYGSCTHPALSKCICGEAQYINKQQYIVNCTNTDFNDTIPLEQIPDNTQVLIFTGNNIPEMNANVFGSGTNNNSQLKVIDMSNNKIRLIHGKAFHRVAYVERLILNHNQLTTDDYHPRIFSNFESLLELHLTDAFDMHDTPDDLASHLGDIFLGSDLNKLRKLHLEQNEINSLNDPVAFCSLESLMDLHLGNNKLQHIDFKLDCLKHLRFLDLEGNSIVSLTKKELSQLDELPQRKQNLTVDLSDNVFTCGPSSDEFFSWLNITSVQVRNKNRLKCKHISVKTEFEQLHMNLTTCQPCKRSASHQAPQSSSAVFLLTLALVASLCALVYTNKEPIKSKVSPIIMSLSRKVHYTTIGKTEVHEMEV